MGFYVAMVEPDVAIHSLTPFETITVAESMVVTD